MVKVSGDLIHLGEEGICQRPRCYLPRDKHSYCYSINLGSALFSPQLLATPVSHAWFLQRGFLSVPRSDLWGAFFLEKLLVETQPVIELCSFGKGSNLLHLEYTTCSITWPAHPAELSHAKASAWHTQLGHSECVSQEGFYLGIR